MDMKKAGFVKQTLIGGFLVLMPLVVVLILVGKAFALLKGFGEAVAAKAPAGLDNLPLATILAIVFFAGLCYALGRMVAPMLDLAHGTKVERTILNRIPGYEILRGIAIAMFGLEGAEGVKPALLKREDGVMELVLAIEALPGDRHVVFLPECPAPMTGPILVVDDRLLVFLPVNTVSALKVFSRWGAGTGDLLSARDPACGNPVPGMTN